MQSMFEFHPTDAAEYVCITTCECSTARKGVHIVSNGDHNRCWSHVCQMVTVKVIILIGQSSGRQRGY